jgi:hypothetical protein
MVVVMLETDYLFNKKQEFELQSRFYKGILGPQKQNAVHRLPRLALATRIERLTVETL